MNMVVINSLCDLPFCQNIQADFWSLLPFQINEYRCSFLGEKVAGT
jgi:hypothetical protein